MPKIKVCCQCGQKKNISNFSKCRSHADGLASICKQCASAYRKKWAELNSEHLRKMKRLDRERKREHYNKLTQKYRKAHPNSRRRESAKRTERHGKELAEYCRQYRQRYPERYRAHQAVNSALRRGVLIRPDACEQCGSTRSLRAHHDKYDEPLAVRWLCESCHRTVHQKEVKHEAVI